MAARTRSSLVGEHCLEFIEPTVVGSQICKWCIRFLYSSGVFKMTRHWKIYKNIKSFIKLNTYSMYNSTQMMSTQYGICSTFKNTIKLFNFWSYLWTKGSIEHMLWWSPTIREPIWLILCWFGRLTFSFSKGLVLRHTKKVAMVNDVLFILTYQKYLHVHNMINVQ